jgi:16S rRNA pseudouridine516 synthase
MDLFPEEKRDVLFPVGRLDKDTEGLLIVTSDGRLSFDLMSPSSGVAKTYFFWALGEPSSERLDEISSGVVIYSNRAEKTCPAIIEVMERAILGDIVPLLDYEDTKISKRRGELPVFSGLITITEGKKHQVKRMLRYAGNRVLYLKRVKISDMELDPTLGVGEYRCLSEEEVRLLQSAASPK